MNEHLAAAETFDILTGVCFTVFSERKIRVKNTKKRLKKIPEKYSPSLCFVLVSRNFKHKRIE